MVAGMKPAKAKFEGFSLLLAGYVVCSDTPDDFLRIIWSSIINTKSPFHYCWASLEEKLRIPLIL